MQIIRFKDIEPDERPDGRTVRKLTSVNLGDNASSAALFYCEVPKSKFDNHYHSVSTEIIMFPEGGNIEINGKEYVMDKWDFVVLQPGDWHGFSGDGANAAHVAFKLPDVEDKCIR